MLTNILAVDNQLLIVSWQLVDLTIYFEIDFFLDIIYFWQGLIIAQCLCTSVESSGYLVVGEGGYETGEMSTHDICCAILPTISQFTAGFINQAEKNALAIKPLVNSTSSLQSFIGIIIQH